MAALTANRERFVRAVGRQEKGSGVGVDSDEFYEGQLVCFNGSGKIAPAADTAGFRVAGVCTKRVTTGASNTTEIEFEYGHQEWFPHSGLVNADIGANCVVSDDNTVTETTTATNDVEVGLITEIESLRGTAGVWIRIAEFGVDTAA
jgi:hypothetical protein